MIGEAEKYRLLFFMQGKIYKHDTKQWKDIYRVLNLE